MPGDDAYNVLLLHCDGADASTTFTDSATGKTVTAVGTAQIDTAQAKFGGSSCLLDGDSDYLTLAGSADFTFGTGDFTVDWWLRWNGSTSGTYFMEFGDMHNAPGFSVHWNAGLANKLGIYNATIGWIDLGAWTPSANTWYHLALVRYSNTVSAYVNGNAQATTYDAIGVSLGNNTTTSIGCEGAASGLFNGWFDEIRVSKGIARWTANFTPPTNSYSIDQSVAGILASTGSISKQTLKPLSGILNSSGTLSKIVSKLLSGTLILTGIANKLTWQAISGTLTFAGAITKTTIKALTGIVTFTGNITKITNKALSGSLVQTGTITKLTNKNLSGILSFTGIVNKLIAQAIEGYISFLGKVYKQTNKSLSGTFTFRGLLGKLGWNRLIATATSWTQLSKDSETWTADAKDIQSWTADTKDTQTWIED